MTVSPPATALARQARHLPHARIACQKRNVTARLDGLGGQVLQRDRCQVGPKHSGWPVHSCGNTAMKGCSWPNFWANSASFSLWGSVAHSEHRAVASRTVDERLLNGNCTEEVGPNSKIWPNTSTENPY
jgi:hypothetical protein